MALCGEVVRLWKSVHADNQHRPAEWSIATREAVSEAFCTLDGLQGSNERHYLTSIKGLRLHEADKRRGCSGKVVSPTEA